MSYEECVIAFLDDHPEFYITDIEYCPDVRRMFIEETGYEE